MTNFSSATASGTDFKSARNNEESINGLFQAFIRKNLEIIHSAVKRFYAVGMVEKIHANRHNKALDNVKKSSYIISIRDLAS